MNNSRENSEPGFGSHASTEGINRQPRLGSTDAPNSIIAFEDPSCPQCRQFENDTLPSLREPIGKGKLRFYYRGYPVVYPWGEPACQALEATYSRDSNAFWSLKNYYYEEQQNFTMDNVLDRTQVYLEDETTLSMTTARQVISDVRDESFSDAVDLDLRAGRRAGVLGTPTFFLFSNKRYVTQIQGPQGYGVFRNTLGL